MGAGAQLKVLGCSLIKERFGVVVVFGEGNIVYKETDCNIWLQVWGHFGLMPLLWEVHLLPVGATGTASGWRVRAVKTVLDLN